MGKRNRCSYSLLPGRSGNRIQLGVRFSAFVQTGPRAHLAFLTMGVGSLSRTESGLDVVSTTHPLPDAEVKGRGELYLVNIRKKKQIAMDLTELLNFAYISKFMYSQISSRIPNISEDNRNIFCPVN